jgi:hypothetical protein
MVVVAVLVIAPRAQAAADEFLQAATVTSANGVAGDYTGGSVAISADGSTMVVGVPEANGRQGEAYVYTRGANGWQTANEPAVLSASNGAADDEFGYSVSVSQDGSVVAVGAPYANAGGNDRGEVYVFDRQAGGWAPQSAQTETTSAAGPADFDRLGYAVALSPDGTYLAAGATGYSSSGSLTGQGGVYVWGYSGGVLSTEGTEPLVAGDASNEDGLGWSVAMPSDSLIYAGAPYHPGNDGPGAVYGFSSENSIEVGYTPWAHVSKTELSAAGSSLFGASVAASGGIVAAGAPDTGSDEGNVYLFEPGFGCLTELLHGCFEASTYTAPLASLSYPSGTGKLGYAVALTGDGTAVLAGAPGYAASPPAPAGAAYVFQAPGGGWASATTPNATLQPADTAADDDFGWAVALSGDGGALAVGDPSGNAATAGEADVFEGRTQSAVSCQPGTVGVGQPTTCTATITDDGIAEATPMGTVGFATDSAGSFGATSCTLTATGTGTSSCHVTYTPSAAGSGAHVLTVQYAGDDKHAPGTGQTTVAINRLTTSTAVSCSPSPVTVGEAADCTATVTASDASAGPPTGTVMFTTNGPGTFSDAGCTLPAGSGATASCTSTYTPSAIGPGTHQLTAAYAGDGGHAASQGSDPLGVAEASTGISINCTPLSVAVGKVTQCTATVTDTGSGGPAPTGEVTATSTGAGTLSTCTLAIHESAVAVCAFSYTPANAATPSPRLTAIYGGDADHFASSASALLMVPPTGSPAVTIGRVSTRGDRIVLELTCPETEAYCKVKVTIKVGSRTLAAGSATVAGGSVKALLLAPKAAVLRRLRAGRHVAKIAVVAVDQSGHRKRGSLAALLSTGKHFKLVTLVIRK